MPTSDPKALPKAVVKAIRRGWSVFPVGLDKRPIEVGKKEDGGPQRLAWKKYQTTRATLAQAEVWQRRFHPPAWAVITGAISGIFITDHDEYKPGAITLEKMGLGGRENVLTGSGGKHVYWPHPGYRVPTLSSEQTKAVEAAGFPGFDIRGDGGYAIFYGENSHGRYKWLAAPDPTLTVDLLPFELRQACKFLPPEEDRSDPTPAAAPRPAAPAATAPATGKGLTPFPQWALHKALANQGSGRNAAGFALACMMRDQGHSKAEALDIMREFQARVKPTNTKEQKDPYTLEEAQSSVTAAYSKPKRPAITPAALKKDQRQAPAAALQAAPPEVAAADPDPPPADDPAIFDADPDQRTLGFGTEDIGAKKIKPSDIGNAERLILRHGQDLRYCRLTEEWFIWDRKRFETDQSGGIVRKAIDTVRAIYTQEANKEGDDDKRKAILAHALKSESASALNNMVRIATNAHRISVLPAELDANPWLLNFPNGTLDLRTLKLREHRRADLITKTITYPLDQAAKAPAWEGFIRDCCADPETGTPDTEYEEFLQRALGYCLTGADSEKVLFIAHGKSNAGKTTLVEVIRAALGSYAGQIRIETLMRQKNSSRGDEASPEIADLQGKRFVATSETEEGQRLAEAKVKYLTGMGIIRCRRLFKDPIEFPQTWKFVMDCNHLPRIDGSDPGIWNRIRRLPFDNVQPILDRSLKRRMLQELPGIMAYMARGLAMWLKHGLGSCARIQVATEEYRQDQDSVSRFINDCCILADSFSVPGKMFYDAYTAWATESNEYAISAKALSGKIAERGIGRKHENSGVRYLGIRMATPEELADRYDRKTTQSDGCDGSDRFTRKIESPAGKAGSSGNLGHMRHNHHAATAEEREF